MDLFAIAEAIGKILDFVGILIILGGIIIFSAVTLSGLLERKDREQLYLGFRKGLGRSILLGLEFLVAGDIIRSVTGTPSFASVGVLAVIVLIRSFLGITFEMEIDGRWPWEKNKRRE